jgi:hypothetical protein
MFYMWFTRVTTYLWFTRVTTDLLQCMFCVGWSQLVFLHLLALFCMEWSLYVYIHYCNAKTVLHYTCMSFDKHRPFSGYGILLYSQEQLALSNKIIVIVVPLHTTQCQLTKSNQVIQWTCWTTKQLNTIETIMSTLCHKAWCFEYI